MNELILAMILSNGITTNSPIYNLQYLHYHNANQIAFQDITKLTRICVVGQYGVYFTGKTPFQILGCSTDTIFRSGFEVGETNKPK